MLLPITAMAQHFNESESYTLSNTVNDNDGLPQNSIIGQYLDTTSGMFWLATSGGLVRFNGVSAKSFTNSTYPALLINQLVCLFKTTDQQVHAMNIRNQIIHIREYGIELDKYYSKLFNRFEGFVWFKGVLQSLNQIRQLAELDRGNPAWYPLQETWVQNGSNYYVTALTEDQLAAVSRTTSKLLIYRNRSIIDSFPAPDPMSAKLVYQNGYLYVLDNKLEGNSYKVYPAQIKPQPAILGSKLLALKQQYGSKGKIFYNELNDQLAWQVDSSIYLLKTEGGMVDVEKHFEVSNIARNISHINWSARHEVLLLGTSTEGLFVYRKNHFNQLIAPYKEINVNSTYAQLWLNDHELMTNRGVVYEMSKPETVRRKPLQSGIWTSFSRGGNGIVYLHNDTTAYTWDPVTDIYQPVHERATSIKPGFNNIQFTWFDPEKQRLWLLEQKRWGYLSNRIYYPVIPLSKTDIPKAFCFAQRGDTTIIATEKGLMIRRNARDTFACVDSTADKVVRFARVDGRYCWIGTYGHGYGLLDLQTFTITWLPRDPKNYLNNVHALIDDQLGFIWASTDKGLFRFRKDHLLNFTREPKATLQYDYFDQQDGLATNEFNGGAQPNYSWHNGQLLLSSINGIAIFSPASIKPDLWDEPIYVDHVETGTRKDVLAGPSLRYEFNPDERHITWIVNRAAWHNPYSMRIEYSLDNQNSWKALDNHQGTLILEGVAAGSHKLYIRNYTGAGHRQYRSQVVEFSIAYHLWEREWFIFLVALGVLGIVGTLVWLRMSIRGRKRDAERMVDVINANDKLEDANLFKSKLISILVHDFSVQVASIEMVSGMLHKEDSARTREMEQEALKEVNTAARHLKVKAEQLVQWAKIQNDLLQPKHYWFFPHPYVEQLQEKLQWLFEWKENEFVNRIDHGFEMTGDPVLIRHVLYNLVINANKHTTQGRVEIGALEEGNNVVLYVKDTGTGIQQYQKEQLMEGLTKVSRREKLKERAWGLGYQVIFDLLLLMNGNIEIESKEGEGTLVRIILPQ